MTAAAPLLSDDDLPATVADAATAHLAAVLSIALEHGPAHKALVVYDARTPLARALLAGYRRNLPDAAFVDFDSVTPDAVLAAFRSMAAHDLVVLIQSTNFRLDGFRIRVELFKLDHF
jgi:aminopeptidase